MDIKPEKIAIRDLIADYSNDPNNGVYGKFSIEVQKFEGFQAL